MASKGNKETIVSKLGFKSSSSASKAEAELEKVRKENAHLRKKVDDLAKRHIRPPDSDKSKLLERILSLETMRERNNQQLLVKEQELETLRQQLSARGGEVIASLQSQLEQRRREVEQRDTLFQSLSQETENLKNKLATVSARCQSMETQVTVPPADVALVHDQLRHALEKNQQWLMYDQQREAFVQSVLARSLEMEQQLGQAKQQQQQQQQSSQEAGSDGDKPSAPSAGPEKEAQLRSHYDQLLSGMQKELEGQKDQIARSHQELNTQREQTLKAQTELQSQRERVAELQEEMLALQRRQGDKSRELKEAKAQLQAERFGSRQAVSNERRATSEREDRMREDMENMDVRLEEERKRSAELLLQVNMLQKSLLNQTEERGRIALLEQQIQLSAKDSEDEKMDRQNMQHQMHKVLKELRKARDQIAKLESAKLPNARFSEPSSYNNFERLTIDDAVSPSKVSSILDESFLECPKCRASYPTTRHRELLAHIDYCFA